VLGHIILSAEGRESLPQWKAMEKFLSNIFQLLGVNGGDWIGVRSNTWAIVVCINYSVYDSYTSINHTTHYNSYDSYDSYASA
jgi:hypothetical protein